MDKMIPANCTFCGLCCTLTVRLSDKDIKRIESSGRQREEFAVADSDGRPVLKRDKGWCTFFRREGKIGICTIYDSRPEACRDFPGKRLCDLAENPMYKYMNKKSDESKRIRELLKNAPTAKTAAGEIKEAQENGEKTFTGIRKC